MTKITDLNADISSGMSAELTQDFNDGEDMVSKESRLADLELQLEPLTSSTLRAEILLDYATLLLDFQRKEDSWIAAWEAFNQFSKDENWELAVVATDILVSADQKDSMLALAHGVWLGITYPINPETSNAILQHLIDESPVGSETAAVAAVTAHFLADMRAPAGKDGESIRFFTSQRLAEVAAQHRSIKSQEEFDIWMQGNEFNNPDSFLPKLSAAIDALADDRWWIDRDALRASIPK